MDVEKQEGHAQSLSHATACSSSMQVFCVLCQRVKGFENFTQHPKLLDPWQCENSHYPGYENILYYS
jgi:hypothetical protein